MNTPKETEEEKADRLYDELLQANVLELMKTGAGKKVIWHILGLCGIYASSFTGNSTTFYNEGKRDIGLDVLRMLEDADDTIYARLQLEMIKEGEK